MCNCILETLYSLHHNRCTNKTRSRSIMSLSPSLAVNRSTPEPKNMPSTKESTLKALNTIEKGIEKVDEIDDTDEDYSDFDTEIECQCGKILKKGWLCDTCRKNCSICFRALSIKPKEYCTRCYVYCQEHGFVKRSVVQSDIECTQCDAGELTSSNNNI
ncbi:hypothetical protein K501DRAFT_307513 [Backusella circina FSU 941]|nr:hypothetical protein K501DRAFT_307513 [Backusella circina FSU 941]